MPEEATMKCPYCAEEIKAEAIRCKHCGSDLAESPAKATPPPASSPQAKAEPDAKQKAIGCLVLLVIIVSLAYLMSGGESSKPPEPVSLQANVRFSGTQFTITNNDTFDWTNVELDLNGGTFSSGYVLKQPRMAAGQSYTVGALQFANSEGQRFNPITMKAQRFDIVADTPGGKGFYSGNWE